MIFKQRFWVSVVRSFKTVEKEAPQLVSMISLLAQKESDPKPQLVGTWEEREIFLLEREIFGLRVS